MLIQMLGGNSTSESRREKQRQEKRLLHRAARQVKELVEIAPQESYTIRKAIKQDYVGKTGANQDVQHMVIFFIKFGDQKVIDMTELEANRENPVNKEKEEMEASSSLQSFV